MWYTLLTIQPFLLCTVYPLENFATTCRPLLWFHSSSWLTHGWSIELWPRCFILLNGFQLGPHRLPADNRQLYEHYIRVPLGVTGLNVPREQFRTTLFWTLILHPPLPNWRVLDATALPVMTRHTNRQCRKSMVPLLLRETALRETLVTCTGVGINHQVQAA